MMPKAGNRPITTAKDALAAEEGLSRCPRSIPPVRRVCTEAAHALVSLIEQQADGYATGKTKQPEPKQAEAKQTEVKEAQSKQADAKQAYAMRAMDGLCALGHRVPDHGLILGCRRAWRSEKHVKNGLIATPGGLVRRPPDTIPVLLGNSLIFDAIACNCLHHQVMPILTD